MNWFDIVLLLILVTSVASGFARGFVRIGIGFVATVVGFILAAWMYGTAGAWFDPYVHSRAVANLLGFVLVFIAVILIGGLVSFLLARMLRLVGLGFLDRLGGALVGAVRGVVIGVVIVMAFMAFTRRPPEAVVNSRFAPYLVGSARTISRLAPYEVRDGVRKAYDELWRVWRDVSHPRKKPATEDL